MATPTDMFGNPYTDEELRDLYLNQMAMGLVPHFTRTKGLATPPSVDYNRVMEDWSDPNILSAPAFDSPRPTTIASVTPTDPTLAGMSTVGLSFGPERQPTKPSPLYPDAIIRDAMLGMYDYMPDSSIVSDMPGRRYVDPYKGTLDDMPTAILPPDTQLRMLDDAMPHVEVNQPIDTGVIPVDYSQVMTDAGTATAPFTGMESYFGDGTQVAAGDGWYNDADHLGNVFSVQNRNKFDLGHLNPYGMGGPLPLDLPSVGLGLPLGLTAAATAAGIAALPVGSEGTAPDYSQMAQDWGDPTIMSAPAGIEPTTAGMADVDFERFLPGEDLGMVDPTWPDSGGLGKTTTVSLPEVISAASIAIPGGKVVSSGIKGLVKALTKGTTKTTPKATVTNIAKKAIEKKSDKIPLYDEWGSVMAYVDSAHPVITQAQSVAKQINKIGNPFARQMARAKAIEDIKSTGAGVVQLAVATAALSPKGALERKAAERQKAATDKERTRMHDLAVQQAADKHKANVAAAQAKHKENLRVAELTRQAVARQQQAAAQQAQIAREVQAAQDRVRQATALMNSKAYNESGMGGLTAAERDIVAAAQVDTFAGMGAEGPMSAAEINVAGGMEFGGAGGMRGGDRGGGGRGGPGGRGR